MAHPWFDRAQAVGRPELAWLAALAPTTCRLRRRPPSAGVSRPTRPGVAAGRPGTYQGERRRRRPSGRCSPGVRWWSPGRGEAGDRVGQGADELQRRGRVGEVDHLLVVRAAGAGSGRTARTPAANRSYRRSRSARCGHAGRGSRRRTSATVRQKASSSSTPAVTRIALRKRRKQSNTSVKIDSSLMSSGTSARIRSTCGGSVGVRVHHHDLLGDVLEDHPLDRAARRGPG